MKDFFYDPLKWIDKHIWDLVCGWITAALCYFFEIKSAIHVMLIIVAADLFTGIIASVFIRGESFSMSNSPLQVAEQLCS